MESNDKNSGLYGSNNLHFHIDVVCWRPYCLPFISHQYKSGKRPHLQHVTTLWYKIFPCDSIGMKASLHLCALFDRLHMRISDIDTIGEPTHITKELLRILRRYFARAFLRPRMTSGKRCQGNLCYLPVQAVGVL